TTPVWSRRSTNARCSPCSRRRATQPVRATAWPTCSARSAPHWWVRMEVGWSVIDGVLEVGGEANDELGPVDGELLAFASERADRHGTGVTFVGADDQRQRRSAAVGGLHLALHAA